MSLMKSIPWNTHPFLKSLRPNKFGRIRCLFTILIQSAQSTCLQCMHTKNSHSKWLTKFFICVVTFVMLGHFVRFQIYAYVHLWLLVWYLCHTRVFVITQPIVPLKFNIYKVKTKNIFNVSHNLNKTYNNVLHYPIFIYMSRMYI